MSPEAESVATLHRYDLSTRHFLAPFQALANNRRAESISLALGAQRAKVYP